MRGIRQWGAVQWSSVAGIVGALAAVVALFLPGDSGDGGAATPNPSVAVPKQVARESIQHFHGARWDAMWEGLHPVDQAVAPRKAFVSCQDSAAKPSRLLSMKLQDPVPYPTRVRPTIPADDVRVVDGQARTLVRIDGKTSERPETFSEFVAKDGDEWKSLLEPGEYRLFRRGRCPYPPREPDASGPSEFSTPESYK